MLIDSMGIILADNGRVKLGELSDERALAATPFGGRYRIIDFMLSSMVNSGIKHVGILAETKYSSLMDHLGTGSHWDLDRLQQGLRIIPPYMQSDFFRSPNPQDLNGLYDFLKHSVHLHVVVAESNLVSNINFAKFVKEHEDSGADVTVMYNHDADSLGSPNVSLTFEDNKLVDLRIDPLNPTSDCSSLGCVVLTRTLLMDLLAQAISRGESLFNTEFILEKYKELTIRGFENNDLTLRINSLATYFSASMRLLEKGVLQKLYKSENRIFTKVKNEAPARYPKGNHVANSLISDGCNVVGQVENSVIFRGVSIGKHSKISNCIIMQDTVIRDGAELKNVIIDKDSVIRSGVRLQGSPDYPVVIRKGVIV
ncbi:MAG: glucose-1-phosphate adenylyltransferase subunit GlgD [Clostridiaceae bacterium]|nr:glucose-1-phosphate adenylyltransferase subunit GlgD [Clostridiaceae bacterium]